MRAVLERKATAMHRRIACYKCEHDDWIVLVGCIRPVHDFSR